MVVDLAELETMYQDFPKNSIYTQICKGTTTKCTLSIFTNNVSIIVTNSKQWSYVTIYKVK